jgi:hypothetical protein
MPAPRSLAPRGPAKDALIDGNLFEPERGHKDEPVVESGDTEAAPLPPPTNVVLNGVFVMSGEPMAIVTDSNSGNKQLTLHVGDNVGDYQVGEITERRVTLLGSGGQQFSLDLAIKRGAAGGGARSPVAPRNAGRATPGNPNQATPPPRSPTAAQRAAAQRAANQAQAQTPAQRAAAARGAAAARAARAAKDGSGNPQVDPRRRQIDAAQARLDALRRLREASQAQ